MKKRKIIILLILFMTIYIPFISINAAPSDYVENKVNKVYCGNITKIPRKIPELTSSVVTIIQVAVPIILIIMGSIDLLKGITSQKEDEIKKGQQMLIKRLIVGVAIFFIIVIVKFAISLVADSTDGANITECIDCFLSNNCKE